MKVKDSHIVLSFIFASARRRLISGALVAAITALAGILLLGLSGWFITATAIAGLSITTASVFDVFMPSAGIRFLAIARTISRYAERLVTHDTTFAISADLREKLFRASANQKDMRAIERRPDRLLHRMSTDIDALELFYLRIFIPVFTALAVTVLCGVQIGIIIPLLGVGVAVWLVLAGFGLAFFIWRYSVTLSMHCALLRENLRGRVIHHVDGQTDLIMSGQVERELTALIALDERLSRDDNALASIDSTSAAIYTVFGSLGICLVLVVLAFIGSQSNVSVPVMVFIILTVITVMEVFSALRRGALDAGRVGLAAARIGGELGRTREENKAQEISPAPCGFLALTVQIERAHYQNSDAIVLENIIFDLKQGERVAVIGASGAGKSTLLAAIAGFDIEVCGSIQTQCCALLEQHTTLFCDSFRNNLLLADPNATDTELIDSLRQAGLKDLFLSLEHGFETRLGENNLGLSAGQARRFALARLILQKRPLWLLDEPTESLDALTASQIIENIEETSVAKSMVIITHLAREAAMADRILVMDRGTITQDWRRGSNDFASALLQLRPG